MNTETLSKKLTSDQISRVFSMYYFAGCVTTEFPERGLVKHIGKIPESADYYKLLLTPLSDMPRKDAIEIAKIIYPADENWSPNMHKAAEGETFLNYMYDEQDFPSMLNFPMEKAFFVLQYLLKKGYAVPLFFEVDHPLNGKTAIELGIAVNNNQTKQS